MSRVRLSQVVVITLAAIAGIVRWPADWVEQYFARGIYPRVQGTLTAWSNQTGVALFDFLAAVGLLVIVVTGVRSIILAVQSRSPSPLLRAAGVVITIGAIAYLWFLGAWGLNYGRQPLEAAVGYQPERVSAAGVRGLASRAVDEVNRWHAPGHAAGFPAAHEMPPSLVGAIHEIERRLGRPVPTTPSRPKRTVLGPFLRAAGVDGMHAPFLLETILNPDLTPAERPAVLAHEWAHLAGYAPEDDASFVGLLAALRADPASRYSAWFALFHETASLLPRAEQQKLVDRLGPGPQEDRAAIVRRQQARVEVVSRASWETYDRYLKAQGVPEGVQSYSRVVQLLLGTDALDW
jgi:hypothetical protein